MTAPCSHCRHPEAMHGPACSGYSLHPTVAPCRCPEYVDNADRTLWSDRPHVWELSVSDPSDDDGRISQIGLFATADLAKQAAEQYFVAYRTEWNTETWLLQPIGWHTTPLQNMRAKLGLDTRTTQLFLTHTVVDTHVHPDNDYY